MSHHKSNTIDETQAHEYLQYIEWDKKEFTNYELEIMLAASCLRYLGDMTSIEFVLGISEEMRKRQTGNKENMSAELILATSILHDVSEMRSRHRSLQTDQDTAKNSIDEAQEIITRIKFLS